jgi:hypothetical protein
MGVQNKSVYFVKPGNYLPEIKKLSKQKDN